MKTAWIINHYAQMGYGVGSSRHYSIAKSLGKNNWEVCILASSIELNTNKKKLSDGESSGTSVDSNVTFRWIAVPGYKGNGIDRMFNMLIFSFRLLLPGYRKGLKSPDVIIGSTVHPFAAFSAALLARKYKVPFIFEVRDIWPLTLIEFGRLREKSITAFILNHLETWLCRKADKVIAVMPGYSNYVKQKGIDSSKVHWIPNGTDVDMYTTKSPADNKAQFVIMYFGAHGNANSLDTLIKAMSMIKTDSASKNIICRIIGDGSLKEQLKQQASGLGITPDVLRFEEPVPKADIGKLGLNADVFILCTKNLPQLYRYGISMNKLFDYMAIGRPVIMASNAMNNPVADCDGGITIAPEDPQALANAIMQLAESPITELRAMGDRNRSYVSEHHDFSILADKYHQVLSEVVER